MGLILYQMTINFIAGLFVTAIILIPIYYYTAIKRGEKTNILKPIISCVCFSLAYALLFTLAFVFNGGTLMIAFVVVVFFARFISEKICTLIDEKQLRREAEAAGVLFEDYIISKVPEDIIAKCEAFKGNTSGLKKVLKGKVGPTYKSLLIKIYTDSEEY